ncbi:MAG: BMP family ABC transporter substrate-binding protein [Gemmatimonadota bacterium]|nr:BMP family ABC transporter substrate-binding protein [Gemmatimonadota bacterium]MDP7031850.1 BMP family ABC transporter substrate-binding protein [Gemmatimonadota bacterium]
MRIVVLRFPKRSLIVKVTMAVLAVLAVLLPGCGGGSGGGESGDSAFRVGMVFDVGGKGDRSFNDSAFEGMDRARRELGIVASEFEPSGDSDREVGLRKLAAHGYEVVVGVGFLFTDSIRSVATDFPETHFVLVDGYIEDMPNVVSLVFRENEGSFLVGALAAMASKTGVVGFVGGMDIPLIHKFEAGYAAGAQRVNPDARVLVGYAGVRPEAFTDPVRGKEIALSQFRQRADVVFHAAGVTGLGVIEAAREKGLFAIGVDANQNDVAPGTVLTSMIKRVDNAVYRAILASHSGEFRGGLLELGLAEGGVGYSVDEHNRHLLTPEMLEVIQALSDSVIAGEIEIPVETGRS